MDECSQKQSKIQNSKGVESFHKPKEPTVSKTMLIMGG